MSDRIMEASLEDRQHNAAPPTLSSPATGLTGLPNHEIYGVFSTLACAQAQRG